VQEAKSILKLQKFIRPAIIGVPAIGLVLGIAVQLSGWVDWASWIWAAATFPVLLILLTEIVVSLRRGDLGLDVIAALSMLSALLFGEHLAAVIVALMYAGGQYLESFAERRANREMTSLLARVPRTAIRHRAARLEEVDLQAVEPRDRLMIRQGDVVPVDGTVMEGLAVLDQSALTSESIPIKHRINDTVMSGSTNVGAAFDMTPSRRAAESTYAGIVRLVAAAQRSRAPMSRLADRVAMVFLAATVVLAGAAWVWSGDPIRAVGRLVSRDHRCHGRPQRAPSALRSAKVLRSHTSIRNHLRLSSRARLRRRMITPRAGQNARGDLRGGAHLFSKSSPRVVHPRSPTLTHWPTANEGRLPRRCDPLCGSGHAADVPIQNLQVLADVPLFSLDEAKQHPREADLRDFP
jgi:hypothetical protein